MGSLQLQREGPLPQSAVDTILAINTRLEALVTQGKPTQDDFTTSQAAMRAQLNHLQTSQITNAGRLDPMPATLSQQNKNTCTQVCEPLFNQMTQLTAEVTRLGKQQAAVQPSFLEVVNNETAACVDSILEHQADTVVAINKANFLAEQALRSGQDP